MKIIRIIGFSFFVFTWYFIVMGWLYRYFVTDGNHYAKMSNECFKNGQKNDAHGYRISAELCWGKADNAMNLIPKFLRP